MPSEDSKVAVNITTEGRRKMAVTAAVQTHDVKCWPQYFERVLDGSKTFEVRKDDRGYREGDELILREYDRDKGYTGRLVTATVGYVLRDYCAAISDFEGHVVFSLHRVQRRCTEVAEDTFSRAECSLQPLHDGKHRAPDGWEWEWPPSNGADHA